MIIPMEAKMIEVKIQMSIQLLQQFKNKLEQKKRKNMKMIKVLTNLIQSLLRRMFLFNREKG
jgi:hypothetical protein